MRFVALLAAVAALSTPASSADISGIIGGLGKNLDKMREAVPAVTTLRQAQTAPAMPEAAYESLLAAPLWQAPASQPEAVDLRAGFLTPKSQGNRNVCSVFATTGLAEYLVAARYGDRRELSKEALFNQAKFDFTGKPELQAYKSESGLAGYVAVLALQGGVIAETDWPFMPSYKNPSPKPPVTDPEVSPKPEGIAGKTLPYKFSPTVIRRDQIKYFLAKERRPVVMNMMLYISGMDKKTGRLNEPTDAQRAACAEKGADCGGHVILLTGYDPKTGDYTFRNSWGAQWGEGGYGRMSEKYLMENCEACSYLGRLGKMDAASRTMVVNATHGWSAAVGK